MSSMLLKGNGPAPAKTTTPAGLCRWTAGWGLSSKPPPLVRHARGPGTGPATWGRAGRATWTRTSAAQTNKIPVPIPTGALRLVYRAKAHACANPTMARSRPGPGLRGPIARPNARTNRIAPHTNRALSRATPAPATTARPIRRPARQRTAVTTSITATSKVSRAQGIGGVGARRR